jgi:hypothetical protein
MKRMIPLILVSVFCLWTSPEAGQIYQWVDKNGVNHFTNEPPPPGEKIINEQTAIPYNEAADQKRRQEDQKVLDQDLNQQEPQTGQQEESRQETPGVQTGYSEADNSDSDEAAEGVIVQPYVRNREQIRHYERRRQEGEEIVTPLPRRNRMNERRR